MQMNQKQPSIYTHEGGKAKAINPEQQLRRLVMAALLWERQFYVDGVAHADLVRSTVAAVDPAIAAQIAIEARTTGNLRHIPLLLVCELARLGKLKADTLTAVIQRADELSEFLALYWADGKVPISKQVKKGLAAAFRKFNEYALAKYNRDRTIKLRDVLFMVHPKPENDEQAALWKRLADNTLQTPDTWEVRLSGGEDKRSAWEALIAEKKLGGLATLRNLRNMVDSGVSDTTIRQAIEQANYKRVLPFRFIAAARFAPRFEPGLETVFFRAMAEMPKLSGRTVILVDHSGSMGQALSDKSDMIRWDAGAALAMIAREIAEDPCVYVFSAGNICYMGDRYDGSPVSKEIAPRRGFALRDAMTTAMGFGGTMLGQAIHEMNAVGYDRLIVLTDEQSADPVPDPVGRAYMINVAAYQNGVGYGAYTHIDGFSENVFRFIAQNESPLL